MPAEKQTKKQRIDEARETARLAREKREKRQKLLKWLVPSSVTLAILLIGALVTTLIIVNQPAPSFPNGPKNMASDGIVLTGDSGELSYVETAAIEKGDEPTPTEWDADDTRPHVVAYIDWACPVCKSFEEAYRDQIDAAITADQITFEVKPIEITDRNYAGSRYSSRVNNAAACVAEFAPESFWDVQAAVYEQQPAEGTAGLNNAGILDIVRGAGVDDDDVATCIEDEQFKSWVAAATDRALDPDSETPVQGTPTIYVDGELIDFRDPFAQFLAGLSGATVEG